MAAVAHLQAVLGLGLTGLKRTTPSLVVFAVCYGVLALAAVPAARHGLTGLWWWGRASRSGKAGNF